MERRVSIVFEPSGAGISVDAGTTLAKAARLAGVAVETPCGGLGTCGRCRVIVTSGAGVPSTDERVLIPLRLLDAGVRLACRTRAESDMTVTLDSPSARELRIVEDGEGVPSAIEPPQERGVPSASPLGLAVDIGTTTVVATLLDLHDGERLATGSALNPQTVAGADVMSRISHASFEGTAGLRELIIGTIEMLAEEAVTSVGRSGHEVGEFSICGNTTMTHLLLGIDPTPLGSAPYEPAFTSPVSGPASSIGLTSHPEAGVYVVPGVSAFIGGDIVAGLLATGLAERPATVVFLDLGTNGEVVLRTDRGLVAASTAAGPALEGASISCGMRAQDGAIERVSLIDGALELGTIGGGEACGVCGSGLLDLAAALLDAGVIDATGRIVDAAPLFGDLVREVEGVRAFEVAPGVLLTQKDVRQVQLAAAAVASGLAMLLEYAGVAAEAVSELVIAGGFGLHVSAGSLVRLGMIPASWADRVSFAGNTALAGSRMTLLDSDARRRAEAIARHVEVVDLAARPDFQERFVRAMTFPEARP